jgi:hypothetical protein
MHLSVYFPAIMAHIIALPLDKILKTVVSHVAIKYLLDFILLVTVNDSGWQWRVMLTSWTGVGECYGQLDNWKD